MLFAVLLDYSLNINQYEYPGIKRLCIITATGFEMHVNMSYLRMSVVRLGLFSIKANTSIQRVSKSKIIFSNTMYSD